MNTESASSNPVNRLRKVLPEQGWTPSYWSVSQLESLSLKALGLHTYLMSLPDDWQISAERIAHVRKDGRDAIRSAMAELKKHGLLSCEKHRIGGGKFITITTVHAVPVDNHSTGNGKSVSGATSTNTAFAQVGPEPGFPAPVNPVSKKRDSLQEKIKEEIPPPTSSSKETVPGSSGATEEEDFPSDLKNFVANLDYHGQTPTRAEYIRVAKAVRPLWGRVMPVDLKRRLQKNANINAQSLVGVYVNRLQGYRLDDFTEEVENPPRRRTNSSGRPTWCGEAGSCDPNTRRLIDSEGFVGKEPCPRCSTGVRAAERPPEREAKLAG